MKPDRFGTLADFMEAKVTDDDFSMAIWMSMPDGEDATCESPDRDGTIRIPTWECGTVACIGGWTVLAFPKEALQEAEAEQCEASSRLGPDLSIHNIAARVLGMKRDGDADLVFRGGWWAGALWSIKRRDAIDYLRRAAAAGSVMV